MNKTFRLIWMSGALYVVSAFTVFTIRFVARPEASLPYAILGVAALFSLWSLLVAAWRNW